MTDPEVDRFQQDLAAAIAAGVPLSFGRRSRPRDLEQWCRVLKASGLSGADTGRMASTGTFTRNPDFPPAFEAAIRTCEATGSMTCVLDGLTVTRMAEQEVRRGLRWPFFCLQAVVLIAIIGLLCYQASVLPRIEMLHRDLSVDRMAAARPGLEWTHWLPGAVVVLASSLWIGLLVVWYSRTCWLRLALGGVRFVQLKQTEASMRTMAALERVGIDWQVASRLSSQLTGGSPFVVQRLESAGRDLAWLQPEMPVGSGNTMLPTVWSVLADYYSDAAKEKLRQQRIGMPLVLLTLVGGLVALGYALSIFGPLYKLLHDYV